MACDATYSGERNRVAMIKGENAYRLLGTTTRHQGSLCKKNAQEGSCSFTFSPCFGADLPL